MLALLTILPGLAALPSVDEPLNTGDRHPSDAAVVIGIEDYFALHDVPYADRDATAVYRYLLRTRGVPADRIRLVSGANREQILSALDEVGRMVKPGGTAWLYFAGHGAADPTGGERLLLGVDAQADVTTFVARGVRVSEAREALRANGGSAVLWLDTCYTGTGRDGAPIGDGTRFAVPAYAMEPKAGTIEWSAVDAGQLAHPLHGAKHGAFTYFSLGAMRGWADGALGDVPDGNVSPDEANAYVNKQLQSIQITDQTTQLIGDTTARAWATDVHESSPRFTAEDRSAPASAKPASETKRDVEQTAKKVLADVQGAFASLGDEVGNTRVAREEVRRGRVTGAAEPEALQDALADTLERGLPPEVASLSFRAFRSRSPFNPDTLTVNATAILIDGTQLELLEDGIQLATRPDWPLISQRVAESFAAELTSAKP